MAPRTAKAKKADVKVADNEAPKKGRGKAKNTEETEQEVPDVEISEKPALADKKKRGKKAQENGDAHINGNTEEVAPPAKRGRKKKEAEVEEISEEKTSNGDHSEEDSPAENGDHGESNGTEEAPATKGRKKPAKADKPKETKGKKGKQASPDIEEKEEKIEEKPKAKGRGRKPKAEATEPEEDKTEPEEAKVETAAKGRRKGQGKVVKEKSPEAEESNEETGKPEEPVKVEAAKKETKGKKGKKTPAKEEGEAEEKEPASKKRKVNKKEEKGQGDAIDEEIPGEDEEIEAAKPAKGKRGKKAEASEADEGKRGKKAEAGEADEGKRAKKAEAGEADDSKRAKKAEAGEADEGKRAKKAEASEAEEEPESDSTTKRRRKAEDKARTEDSKKKAPPKNKATTNYEDMDFTNHSKTAQGKEWNFKISCWNVDGIRAWLGKGGLDYIKHEKPDILCLQETKCSKDKLPEELANLPGYHAYWLDSDKDGYAGVGLYTTRLAMNVHYGLDNKELDDEGRIITAEYEQFYLVCVYVPNAGRKLVTLPKRLQWNEAFLKHVKELDRDKPVIICGDMNVAHNEIDLANPKSNRKNAGFTDEERAGMTELLGEGFVDTYRHFYPDHTGAYTFWTYMMNARGKNVGWRLDYFIVSERLLPLVCDNVIRSGVYGSDHCPISLFLHLTSADKPKEVCM